MATITTAKGPFELNAGERIHLSAQLVGWNPPPNSKKKMPFLNWMIVSGKGEVDSQKGVFTAPILRSDAVTQVLIQVQDNSAPSVTLSVNVKKAKPIEIFPKDVTAEHGDEIRFESKSKFDTRPRFEIVKADSDAGSIDAETGVYTAPAKIAKRKKVKVRVFDQHHHDPKKETNSDTIVVTLLPVEIKAGKQSPMKAGRNKVKLAIKSVHDKNGNNNFTCRIIEPARPLGRVEDGGIYWPPFSVAVATTVKVEATSKLDSSKKAVLEFTVEP